MRRKASSLIAVSALFLSMGASINAAEEGYKVNSISFSNLKQLPEELLLEKIPLRDGDEYTNKTLSDVYLALRKLDYVSNVNIYPKVNGDQVDIIIEVDEVPNALDTARRAESAEEMNKKTEFVVSDVDIEGIKTLNKEDYIKLLPIKKGDYFIPQKAVDGAGELFNAGVFESVEPKVERKTDNTIEISYIVTENPTIQNVSVTGNTLYTEEQLVKALNLNKGELLNVNKLDPQSNGIMKLYNDDGYNLIRIEDINVSRDGDVAVVITEGLVTDITWSSTVSRRDGQRRNPRRTELRTKSDIFERVQEIQPGEIYTKQDMEATIRELYRTGLFTSIEPNFTGVDGDPSARAIDFLVEERPAVSINGSISYGTASGVVGSVKLADSNFLGRGQEASFNVEMSNKGDKTVDISLFDPWLKGTERMQAGLSAYWRVSKYEDADPYELDEVEKFGLRGTLGKGLNSDIYVRTALRVERIKEHQAEGPGQPAGYRERYDLAAITPSIIYDIRDNPYNTKKGIYASLSYEYGYLFNDKTYNPQPDDPKNRNYNQVTADLRAYHPTFFKDKNTMAYRVVWGNTGGQTPEALRFSLGGGESIRGYDPGDFEGYTQFYVNIENRTQLNKFAQVVAFFDIGNAWQCNLNDKKMGLENGNCDSSKKGKQPNRQDAYDFKYLKKGVGVGIRLDTPVGPLRFDYAWPLDPIKKGEEKDSGGKFYFSFGQSF